MLTLELKYDIMMTQNVANAERRYFKLREWLKQLRDNKGFTQQYVSDKLGVTRQYYQQIETGERMPKITMEMICRISKLYNIELHLVAEMENSKNI